MSSDILIGYTGMVSFRHSAFFGIGMYGAAAALLMFDRPNLWVRARVRARRRRGGGGVRRLFLHPPARHLFRHHDADLFPDLLRRHLHLDRSHRRRERPQFQPPAAVAVRLLSGALHHHDAALVRARRGRGVLPDPPPRHALAVRHGAAVDPRERGAHPRDRLPGAALQDGRRDAVRPVRRPRRRALCDPEEVRGAELHLLRDLRRQRP